MAKKMKLNEIIENIGEEDVEKTIQTLIDDDDIIVKDLGNNWISLNFSRDAFFNKKWNERTVTARGLFFNKNTKKIIRGYPKFFNLFEVDTLDDFVKKASFPIKVWHKYNGFLGILGYNDETKELFIASKSTDKGEFADMFRSNLLEKVKDKEDQLKKFLKDFDCSMVFEVIHKDDPHMIKYKENDVVLLDIVKNRTTFKAEGFELVKGMAKNFGFKHKELVKELKNEQDLRDFYEEIEDENYSLNGERLEGFVFEDSKHFMIKFKTGFYNFWKRMRGGVNRLAKVKEKFPEIEKFINVSYDVTKQNYEDVKAKYIETQRQVGQQRRKRTRDEGFILAEYNKFSQYMKELEKVRNDSFGNKGQDFFNFACSKSPEYLRSKSIIELREEFGIK